MREPILVAGYQLRKSFSAATATRFRATRASACDDHFFRFHRPLAIVPRPHFTVLDFLLFPSSALRGTLSALILRSTKHVASIIFTVGAMSWASQAHTHTLSDFRWSRGESVWAGGSGEGRLTGYEWMWMRTVHSDTRVHFAFWTFWLLHLFSSLHPQLRETGCKEVDVTPSVRGKP